MTRRIFMVVPAIAAICLAGTLFGGCSGDDDDDTPATLVPAGQAEIDQDNLAFKPNKMLVAAGDPVKFVNSETALHTVTIDGDNVSGNMKKGDVFEWTAAEAGEYRITCDYHPQMKATITVQ